MFSRRWQRCTQTDASNSICDLKANCQQPDNLSWHSHLISFIFRIRRKLSEDADKNMGFQTPSRDEHEEEHLMRT